MIRGSIELVTSDSIQGWIFVENGAIRDRVLLAFQGDVCVGAGKVNTFRADLIDAGIGDGHLGFSFPISVPAAEIGSVVVKLEGSDAILLQKNAYVTTGAAPAPGLKRAEVRNRLAALKWALKHGRITQSDFDFVRILWSFGVYERGLLRHNATDESIVTDKPLAVAAALLESYAGMEVEVSVARVQDATEFAEELAALASRPECAPILGVHTRDRAVLRVLEGSHVSDASEARAVDFMDYVLSSENLVMLDARAHVELLLPAGATIDIIWASPSLC